MPGRRTLPTARAHGQLTACASVTPVGKEFLFLFDYGDDWQFGVRLVRTSTAPAPDVGYPQVVASHGQAPPQYPMVEDDWDEQTDGDEEFLAQWEQAETEAVEILGQALPAEAGALIAMREPSGLDSELEAAVMTLELADWVGAVVGLVRGGVGASAEPAALVAAIDDCPEVGGTVDPDDADLIEFAFEVVLPIWEAVGAVDGDRRLTALGAWGLPRALAQAWGRDLDTT